MKHSDFKEAARRHQSDFKVNDPEINVLASRYPIRKITRNDKTTVVHVESSLEWRDVRDENGNYRIFFSGFREEITKEVDKPTTQLSNQMVTNLLRSEHIPYNLFFPMMKVKYFMISFAISLLYLNLSKVSLCSVIEE